MKKRNIKKIRDWNTKTKVNSSPVSFNDDKKDLKNKKNNKKTLPIISNCYTQKNAFHISHA